MVILKTTSSLNCAT